MLIPTINLCVSSNRRSFVRSLFSEDKIFTFILDRISGDKSSVMLFESMLERRSDTDVESTTRCIGDDIDEIFFHKKVSDKVIKS